MNKLVAGAKGMVGRFCVSSCGCKQNLSDTEDLVTVMTCNEVFDVNKPDTFGEEV